MQKDFLMRSIFFICCAVFLITAVCYSGTSSGKTECSMCQMQTMLQKGSPFFELAQAMHKEKLNSPPDPHWYCLWYYYYDGANQDFTYWQKLPSSKWAVRFTPANYCTVWTVTINFDIKKNSPANKRDTIDIFVLEANASFTQIYKGFFIVRPDPPPGVTFPLYPPEQGFSTGTPIINTRRDFYVAVQMRGPTVDSVLWKFKTPGINTARSIRFTGPTSTQTATAAVGQSVDLYWDAELCIHIPIPVELSYFGADARATGVKLNWETATETNNYGFQVLRAATKDGPWEPRGFVPGKGSVTQRQTYSFNDNVDVSSLINSGSQNLWYRLKQMDFDGSIQDLDPIMVSLTSTEPDEFSLDQNFPNPFSAGSSGNPTTTIRYRLPHDEHVILTVYDQFGREVQTILNEKKSAGTHHQLWNASHLSGGTYFIKLNAGLYSSTKKMLLVR